MEPSTRVAAVRDVVPAAIWDMAVQLARNGAVRGVSADEDGLTLEVKAGGQPLPFEVWLDEHETDWDCSCGCRQPCVHVAAASIATLNGDEPEPGELPKGNRYQVKLRYDFVSAPPRLAVHRTILRPDGSSHPLTQTLAASNLFGKRHDAQAETLLLTQREGPLDEEMLRRLLLILEGQAQATLDGIPVKLSVEPVKFEVRVTDDAEGFQVGIYRPPGLDQLYLGAALAGGVLRPTSYGDLSEKEKRALHPRRRERVFSASQVGWLISEYLPRLRSLGLDVRIESERLPKPEALVPRVQIEMSEQVEGLAVTPTIVYGDPPLARVTRGEFTRLGKVVPVRDLAAERRLDQDFLARFGIQLGSMRIYPPAEAAVFLTQTLPQLQGVEAVGVPPAGRYRIIDTQLGVRMSISAPQGRSAPTGARGGLPALSPGRDGWGFDVAFESASGRASTADVIRAWRLGRKVVPLVDGGFAELPHEWLKQHGTLLEELLTARNAEGRVSRHATAALVELLEDTEGEVPHDLSRLRNFLEAGEGLPEALVPEAVTAELRPYQLTGFRWLRFLREMELHGILADDMGLGKTLQAICVLADTPGPHLVVAPTSVLDTWAREIANFWPAAQTSVYHGPQRKLDTSVAVTITSYSLLRLDLDKLRAVSWQYAVLDEAQAIKNPDSQTSKAAFALPARHRLCLSGTPVENRLEELWSLFRFLAPGLLGPRETFRERFVRPIEAGDSRARQLLRARVRPYVLRRHKRQVARELPPLTEVVERCELSKAQRDVYNAVRAIARHDVQQAFSGGRSWYMAALEALLRMRQASCDPGLLPGEHAADVPSAKLDRLEELLVEIVPDGHKVLVFSQWTSLLDRVEPRLRALGVDWVRLDGSTTHRSAVVDKFQDPNGPPVFLLSLKAGGTGLTLTAADYVIHLDPWWNPAVERQATDRAHRIGQDKPVVSIKLVAEDTVEERILKLQEHKRELAEVAIGSEDGFVRSLTSDELRALFDFE